MKMKQIINMILAVLLLLVPVLVPVCASAQTSTNTAPVTLAQIKRGDGSRCEPWPRDLCRDAASLAVYRTAAFRGGICVFPSLGAFVGKPPLLINPFW